MRKNKKINKPLVAGGVRKGFRFYVSIVLTIAVMMGFGMTAFAATDDPVTVVNNLSDFIFGLIRAIGMILLGFGIVQIGLSLKSHDASQRANGFMTLAGGVVITFAKEILTLITGG
ncbi:MAG: glutamyl-tRNA amidotransferase [Ethanoligenens sp.]